MYLVLHVHPMRIMAPKIVSKLVSKKRSMCKAVLVVKPRYYSTPAATGEHNLFSQAHPMSEPEKGGVVP